MITIDKEQWDDVSLEMARVDLEWVLRRAPSEAQGVLDALRAGRVNGAVFQENGCGCLIGTIAYLQGQKYYEIPDINQDDGVGAQELFGCIGLRDTPETNEYSALAAQWIEEWIVAETAAREAA